MSSIDDAMKKEIERVSGDVIQEKHKVKKVSGFMRDGDNSALSKFKDTFFEEDAHTVGEGILEDVIIPTIKNLVADIFIGSIERALFGKSRSKGSGYTNYSSSLVRTHTASGTNYSNVSKKPQQPKEEKEKISLNNLIMKSRPDAQCLIDEIKGEIYEHGQICVADVYEMLTSDDEVGSTDFTDNYYGWKNIDGAYIKPAGSGFRVILPKPIQLD